MSDSIFDNVFRTVSEEMKIKRAEMTVVIYESADCVRDHNFRTETDTHQQLQHTGSDSVKNRSSRAVLVCLVLLCVLLLTAVIVLCVHIYTKSTNYTEERDQLRTNNTNLKEERNELLNKIANLTEERESLIMKNTNLTNDREQLRNELQNSGGWTHYQSSLYYISKENKSWTESRRYCTERGADLIIINNREKQDFVNNISGVAVVWIGLTDSDVEGTWKWVDGTSMTSGFWASKEPNGGTIENCAVTVAVPTLRGWSGLVGWVDESCNEVHQWMCEKRISQLTLS